MLDACRADAPTGSEMIATSYADMVASQAMSGISVEAGFSPPEKYADARFTLAYADAYDAYRRSDAAALRDAAARLRAARTEHTGHADMAMGMNNPQAPQRQAVIIQEI